MNLDSNKIFSWFTFKILKFSESKTSKLCLFAQLGFIFVKNEKKKKNLKMAYEVRDQQVWILSARIVLKKNYI